MGNAFCFCDKDDPNLIKGDINIGENQPDNNNSNKLKNIICIPKQKNYKI